MIFEGIRVIEHRPAAVIRVTGDDAFTFLQGQFTNDLRQGIGTAIYGLWLDQKGKVLADSHVLRVSEKEFLITSAGTDAAVIKRRLEDYIVADDVTLTDETAGADGVVLVGEGAGNRLAKMLGASIPAAGFVRATNVMAFAGRSAPGENFEVFGPAEAMRSIRQQLHAAGVATLTPAELTFARIAAGIPAVPDDVGPGDLPNEAGLESVAISFTKGCYLGQEVMARLKNLGQVRRRLHVVRGQGAVPSPRATLYQGDKKVGDLRSVAARGNEFVALAMLSLINFQTGAGLGVQPNGAATIMADVHG